MSPGGKLLATGTMNSRRLRVEHDLSFLDGHPGGGGSS
jgi:hypothetical protein